MIRRIAKALGMFALALTLALLSVWWMLFHAPRSLAMANGPWRMSTVAGKYGCRSLTALVVAVTGLFAR